MRNLRWWSLLLVPGGFVAGHELGYQGASALGAAPVAAGGHGYLSALLLIAAPFAFAAMARSLVAGLRTELPPVRWSTLAAAQTVLFLAVELAEHTRAGLSPPRPWRSRPSCSVWSPSSRSPQCWSASCAPRTAQVSRSLRGGDGAHRSAPPAGSGARRL